MIAFLRQFAGSMTLAASLSALGCDASAPRGESADRGPLKQAVAAIWTDADIGTNASYQQAARSDPGTQSLAPADMRDVTLSLAGGRPLRQWPSSLKFTCQDRRLRISWTGEIAIPLDSVAALQRFDAAMKEHGYQVLEETKAIEKLGQRLGLSAQEMDRWAYTQQYQGYTRKVGQTEIAALAEAMVYSGGRGGVQSGVRFQWFAVRSYPHRQPTLGTVLAALPAWFRVPYLGDAFYAALSRELISGCSAGHDTSIEFVNNVSDTLVKSLEAGGFEYQHEAEPVNGVQKTWERYTDATYAHVITYPDSQRVRFSCQAPQHTGEPRAAKRAPLHPSLRLPQTKRPVLALATLAFADPRLREQARYFQGLAEDIAEDGWFVQRYKDTRRSAAPEFVGSWETTHLAGGHFYRAVLPYRGITITLTGPAAPPAEEKLTALNVGGSWVPASGWGAVVGYRSDGGCSASVGHIEEHDATFSFSVGSSKPVIHLVRHAVPVVARQDASSSCEYTAQLPYDAGPEGKALRRERFLALYTSPETLRDAVLADFAELGRIAADQIARDEGITVRDLTHGDYIGGPQETSSPPSAEAKAALLGQVLAKLAADEQLVRENYREMHAALVQALPLQAGDLP